MTTSNPTILCVAGARPNFTKIAPIMRALASFPRLTARLLHTGQHYDEAMSGSFFTDLGIPAPDISLDVGSGSHATQTAEIMARFEPALDSLAPDCVLVVGDVNSTLACALVAAKKGVRVVHVEAGLRSYDRAMPEEINRVLTDQLSDLLFITEAEAEGNLAREGIAADRIRFVGNVMVDTLFANLARAVPRDVTLAGLVPPDQPFGVVTLHRPSNVDEPAVLKRLLGALATIGADLPLVFPLHPRTRDRIAAAGCANLLDGRRIVALPPLPYLSMLGLMRDASLVMTDSGGIQEETTALGVPCLTLRENTERPVTISQGTNTLVGTDPGDILAAFRDIQSTGGKRGRVPDLWDGHAAERIAACLNSWL